MVFIQPSAMYAPGQKQFTSLMLSHWSGRSPADGRHWIEVCWCVAIYTSRSPTTFIIQMHVMHIEPSFEPCLYIQDMANVALSR